MSQNPIIAKFQGPPTSRSQATLYQHAQEVISLVKQTKSALESVDNVDGLDLNKQEDVVVVSKAYLDHPMQFNPAGTMRPQYFGRLRGELRGQNMKANLMGKERGARLSYQENENSRHYTVFTRMTGSMQVDEDKATGALVFRQSNDFPYRFDQVSTGVEQEHDFNPAGPEELSQASLYNSGKYLVQRLEKKVEKLKSMDNGPRDLNPKEGEVSIADFERLESDNWRCSHFVSPYRVPTDAHLSYEPNTGLATRMSQGFGDSDIYAYQRNESGVEHFSSKRHLDFKEVERSSDGSLSVRIHSSTRQEFIDQRLRYQAERAAWDALPWYSKLAKKLFG